LKLQRWRTAIVLSGGEKMADKKPQPGDPEWTHPDVKGMTDPKAIKALSDAIKIQERREANRVRGIDPDKR